MYRDNSNNSELDIVEKLNLVVHIFSTSEFVSRSNLSTHKSDSKLLNTLTRRRHMPLKRCWRRVTINGISAIFSPYTLKQKYKNCYILNTDSYLNAEKESMKLEVDWENNSLTSSHWELLLVLRSSQLALLEPCSRSLDGVRLKKGSQRGFEDQAIYL